MVEADRRAGFWRSGSLFGSEVKVLIKVATYFWVSAQTLHEPCNFLFLGTLMDRNSLSADEFYSSIGHSKGHEWAQLATFKKYVGHCQFVKLYLYRAHLCAPWVIRCRLIVNYNEFFKIVKHCKWKIIRDNQWECSLHDSCTHTDIYRPTWDEWVKMLAFDLSFMLNVQ